MDIKETQTVNAVENVLLSNADYYKYIFKKTEKIACAVFYIVQKDSSGQDTELADTLKRSATAALTEVLNTLSLKAHHAHRELYEVARTLTALESHVHLAQAGGVIVGDAADLLTSEIGMVLRTLRQYVDPRKSQIAHLTSFEDTETSPFVETAATIQKHQKTRMGTSLSRMSETAPLKGQTSDRQRAIKNILAQQGQVTIKDISERIVNCSEKTIQRELIVMIDKGLVKKEGERRWSRYSLADNLSH